MSQSAVRESLFAELKHAVTHGPGEIKLLRLETFLKPMYAARGLMLLKFDLPQFSGLCGSSPAQKIRVESSSNGSELRSAGFTPHKIRAELSSNGSSRSHPALAESLRTRASFKLRSSDAHTLWKSYLKVRRVRLRQQRHRS